MRLFLVGVLCVLGLSARAQEINFKQFESRNALPTSAFLLSGDTLTDQQVYLLNHRWTLTKSISVIEKAQPAMLSDTTAMFISESIAEDSSYVMLTMYRGGEKLRIPGDYNASQDSEYFVARLYADYDLYNGPLRVTYLLGMQGLGKWSSYFEDEEALARRMMDSEYCKSGSKVYVKTEQLRKPGILTDPEMRSQTGITFLYAAEGDGLDRVAQLPDPEVYLLDQVWVPGENGSTVYTNLYRMNSGLVFAVYESAGVEAKSGIPLPYLKGIHKGPEESASDKSSKERAAKEVNKLTKRMEHSGISFYEMLQQQNERFDKGE